MSYCSSCGEPGEGRFCRMCGAPCAELPADSMAATNVQRLPFEPVHQAAHAQPDSGFDSLFRQPEGMVNPHSRTQVLPPVNADYRMPPPAAPSASPFGTAPGEAAFPQSDDGFPLDPGRGGQDEDWNDDEPGVRKPVLWGTIAAVVAASAVILGLLYIGSHNGGAAAATGSTSASSTPTGVASTQQTIGNVSLPSGSAAASPSASASASPSASATRATGSTSLPLAQGSTGAYVQYVQSRLRQLGYYQGEITGEYDAATGQAVASFQSHAGVTGDQSGTVDRSTITALISAGTRPNLKLGSHSGDVRRLQEALNSAESAGLSVNGKYDQNTAAEVGLYQQRVGLAPTGSMNAQTWSALQSGTIVG